MAVRRYRGHGLVSSMTVMLASALLREKPPPRLPGRDRQTTQALTCPKDQGLLVPARNGKLRCQKCGRLFERPQTRG
jgi:hypothetical protein